MKAKMHKKTFFTGSGVSRIKAIRSELIVCPFDVHQRNMLVTVAGIGILFATPQ